jgi:hypothetical protein
MPWHPASANGAKEAAMGKQQPSLRGFLRAFAFSRMESGFTSA